MNASVAVTLETVRDRVAAAVDADVFTGLPDADRPGLYLFPYQIRRVREHLPPPMPHRPRASSAVWAVEWLWMPEPLDALALIDQAGAFVDANPRIERTDSAIRIQPSALPLEELARVFRAAGVPIRLALAVTVEWEAPFGR